MKFSVPREGREECKTTLRRNKTKIHREPGSSGEFRGFHQPSVFISPPPILAPDCLYAKLLVLPVFQPWKK
jgi:hypothetical protein